MAKTNLEVGEKNCLDIYGGKKRLVRNFRRQYQWKCIWCIILEDAYRNKGNNLWEETKLLLVSRKKLNYKEILVGTLIY